MYSALDLSLRTTSDTSQGLSPTFSYYCLTLPQIKSPSKSFGSALANIVPMGLSMQRSSLSSPSQKNLSLCDVSSEPVDALDEDAR